MRISDAGNVARNLARNEAHRGFLPGDRRRASRPEAGIKQSLLTGDWPPKSPLLDHGNLRPADWELRPAVWSNTIAQDAMAYQDSQGRAIWLVYDIIPVAR